MKTARYWHQTDGTTVQCDLCPHGGTSAHGTMALGGVRENRAGGLFSFNYFGATCSGIEPIQKKPLYHFLPGSGILSLGTFGCNFSCKCCQNYNISKKFPQSHLGAPNFSREEIINSVSQRAKSRDLFSFSGVSYTYSEPTVWPETILDLGPAVRDLGLKNVFVTNGFINPEPLNDLLAFADAFNIDLKALDDEFYRTFCGGRLAPVLETIKTASRRAHVELTTLVIPTLNDSTEHFAKLRDWIAGEIGPDTPVHLSRYYPMYKLSLPPTPPETLYRARDVLSEKLHYVYIGNLGGEQDTRCAQCGALVIERTGYATHLSALNRDGTCSKCGARIAVGE